MKIAKPMALKKASKQVTRNIHTVFKGSEMTKTSFSKAIGISTSTLRRIENAYKYKRPYNPSLTTLLKMSTATGLTLDEVVKETVVME